MANQTNSLSHTKRVCKYHIIIVAKYRIKIIYNQYRESLREIIRLLCKYKGVEIIEGKYEAGSCTHAFKYTTKAKCVKLHGVFIGEKRTDDV